MIVLPMAGLSSRFFNAGYEDPKYMLKLEGRSVFAHALASFEAYFNTERFLVICRDIFNTPEFVRAECAKLGLAPDRLLLISLDAETSGQAETVAVGLSRVGAKPSAPLTIFNIDTFRPGFRHPDAYDIGAIDGYVEVFEGEGDHWSFVRPDEQSPERFRAAEVTEKIRISNYCSTGLYYFRSVKTFLDLYAGIANADVASLQGGERYIAPLYNTAIQSGMDIRYHLIGPEEVRFCGTPEEYEALKAAAL